MACNILLIIILIFLFLPRLLMFMWFHIPKSFHMNLFQPVLFLCIIQAVFCCFIETVIHVNEMFCCVMYFIQGYVSMYLFLFHILTVWTFTFFIFLISPHFPLHTAQYFFIPPPGFLIIFPLSSCHP